MLAHFFIFAVRSRGGKASPLIFRHPLQIGHLFIAGLLESGHHVLKAGRLAGPASAALPFKGTGPSGAYRTSGSGTALLGARSRIHGFFHGKADLAVFADAEHLDLDRLVLRYKVADFLYKRRGDL